MKHCVLLLTGISDFQLLVRHEGRTKRAVCDGQVRALHEALLNGSIPFCMNTDIDPDTLDEIKLVDPLHLWAQQQQPVKPPPALTWWQRCRQTMIQYVRDVAVTPDDPQKLPESPALLLDEQGRIQWLMPKIQALLHDPVVSTKPCHWLHVYTQRNDGRFEREPIANDLLFQHWLMVQPLPLDSTYGSVACLQQQEDIRQPAVQQVLLSRLAQAINAYTDTMCGASPTLIIADTGGIPELKTLVLAQTALLAAERWQWVRYLQPQKGYIGQLKALQNQPTALDQLYARATLRQLLKQGAFVEMLGITARFVDTPAAAYWARPLQQWGLCFRDMYPGYLQDASCAVWMPFGPADAMPPCHALMAALTVEAALQANNIVQALAALSSFKDKAVIDFYNRTHFANNYSAYINDLDQAPGSDPNRIKQQLIAEQVELQRLVDVIHQTDKHGASLQFYRNKFVHTGHSLDWSQKANRAAVALGGWRAEGRPGERFLSQSVVADILWTLTWRDIALDYRQALDALDARLLRFVVEEELKDV